MVKKDYKWGVLGHTQLGATHVRQGLPNQDALDSFSLSDGSCPVVVAVADGHGSAKAFRSDTGAAIAVKAAVEECINFFKRMGNTPASAIKAAAEQHIPPRIFQTWKCRVLEHFAQYPFTASEWDRLAQQVSPADYDRIVQVNRPQLAYGSTLLVAIVTDEYLIAFQLGDGDILTVSDATGDTGYFIPKDESLIANETTSLCQDNAWKYVRYRFQVFQDHPPALVILSTDGYSNSFTSSAGFLKAGTDLLDRLQAQGAESLQVDLPTWLEETSREGSGDDITLGVIYRIQPAPSLRSHSNKPCDTAPPIEGERTSTVPASLPDSSTINEVFKNGSQSAEPMAFPACETTDEPQPGSSLSQVEAAMSLPEVEDLNNESEPSEDEVAASLDGPAPPIDPASSSSSSSQHELSQDEARSFPFVVSGADSETGGLAERTNPDTPVVEPLRQDHLNTNSRTPL